MKWMKRLSIKVPSGRSSGEAAFSVTLECKVTRACKAGGRQQLVQVKFEGDGANRTFTMNQAMDIPCNKEGVHDVLRGLMSIVTLMLDLNLIDSLWEDIFSKSMVPLPMALACEAYQDGCIGHATIGLAVEQEIKFIVSKVLLMLYVEAMLAGCQDYSICLEDAASHVVDVPCYGHAFHHKVHHQVVQSEIRLLDVPK